MAAVSTSNRARSSLLGSNKARRKLRGHLENIAIDGRHLYSVLVPFYFDCVVYQSSKFFLFLTTDRISLDAIRRTTRHGGRNDDIDSHSERFGQSRYHLYSFLQQGKCYADLIVGSIEDGILLLSCGGGSIVPMRHPASCGYLLTNTILVRWGEE